MMIQRRTAFTGAVLCILTVALLVTSGTAGWTVPTWEEELRAYYDYDATAPLNAVQTATNVTPSWEEIRFSFDAHAGGRAPGVVYFPRGQSSAPLILFLHGYKGSKEDATTLARFMCPQGVAIMAIDAMRHGERGGGDAAVLPVDLEQVGQNMIATIIDNRRALDYAATRDDVESDRILLVGVSMGGIFGSILTAVEPRIDGAALLVAGGRWDMLFQHSQHEVVQQCHDAGVKVQMLKQHLAAVEPVNFAAHIAPRPLFMANGRQDRIIVPPSAQALYGAARQPKEIHWYDAGHIGTVIQAALEMQTWLSHQLSVLSQEVQ